MRDAPLLQTNGLCVDTPSGRPLIRGLALSIGREQVAVVGRNGVGKSTLLEVLAGHAEPDGGTLVACGERLLVPQQALPAPDEASVSPGQRRRRALERAFDARPDLLLLDEPTLDLDAPSLGWLAQRLRAWRGGLIVVSHDRRILRSFEHFFVVAETGCRYFAGSFDDLTKSLQEASRSTQEAYVRHLQRLSVRERHDDVVSRRRARKKNLGRVREIGRGKPRIVMNSRRGAAQVSQGRSAAQLEQRASAARAWAKATRRALSVDLPLEAHLPPAPPETGDAVVRLERVSGAVGARTLFDDVDLEISARDRVAIVGPNGAGKTTLVEILLREREPSAGRARARTGRIGFIAQNGENWRKPESLIGLLATEVEDPDALAARILAHRFPLALAERPLASLSPGERVRAALILLFQRRPTVELLVLDEPTDHLDFVGLAALEAALRGWRGGLCVVSHDEEFLRAIGVERRIALGSSGSTASHASC